ncbi:MAG: TIGR01906 family membrane protein [Anaerolineae bacterium]|nr:TIGR01906 family membrane protein [Anaerolineae bacterium]
MPRPILIMIQYLLIALVPILLMLISVRLMLTETWLDFEYSRLPEDAYGWDNEVRQEYGPYGIRYLLNDEDISYLADLKIDGQPAFREKELEHMEDVQAVTQAVLWVLTISLILFAAGITLMAYLARARLLSVFFYGGAVTLITIVLLVVLAVVSWDFFFDTFHAIFFAEDSWRFYRDDTLIRLYPQQFWFESSLVVGILTIGGAMLCMMIPWRIWRRGGF